MHRDCNPHGNKTIGEELQLSKERRQFYKAWAYDIGIILVTFACGGVIGYYVRGLVR
jgi:hypothetical protein